MHTSGRRWLPWGSTASCWWWWRGWGSVESRLLGGKSDLSIHFGGVSGLLDPRWQPKSTAPIRTGRSVRGKIRQTFLIRRGPVFFSVCVCVCVLPPHPPHIIRGNAAQKFCWCFLFCLFCLAPFCSVFVRVKRSGSVRGVGLRENLK